MIDRELKRSLGQMMKGVEVVGARHGGVARASTSHSVTPVVVAGGAPQPGSCPVVVAAGEFSVSILAGDQIAEGQYFSYPGRKFAHVAEDFITGWPDDPHGPPIVPNSIAWLRCRVLFDQPIEDHRLLFARVEQVIEGRLREPPLLYSSRLGWRIAGDKAREPGVSIRDQLLARLGVDGPDDAEPAD